MRIARWSSSLSQLLTSDQVVVTKRLEAVAIKATRGLHNNKDPDHCDLRDSRNTSRSRLMTWTGTWPKWSINCV